MKIILPAVVVRINTEINEALVRFGTGETKVVEVDEDFAFDCPHPLEDLEGEEVEIEFDVEDEFLIGKIVWVNTECPPDCPCQWED